MGDDNTKCANLPPKRSKSACDHCKIHKVKCDSSENEPCSQCVKKKLECLHSPPLKRGRKLSKSEPQPNEGQARPLHWFHPTQPQARVQNFMGIAHFFPFFSFQVDNKIAEEVWSTLYFRKHKCNLLNATSHEVVLNYIEHSIVFAYGCHLMADYENSLHFFRLEDELFSFFEAYEWKVGLHLVSRLIEALLMKLDFESEVIKVFSNLSNTFSLIYDLLKENEDYIKPTTVYRVLTITTLSPWQDVAYSLKILDKFLPEVSNNMGNMVNLVMVLLSRFFDYEHQGYFSLIGRQLTDETLEMLNRVLDKTEENLNTQRDQQVKFIHFECCLVMARVAFLCSGSNTLCLPSVFGYFDRFFGLVLKIPVLTLSTQLKNCFIIANRICSYYNLLELGNRVSHVYMQFEYHRNTVVSNFKFVPPVSHSTAKRSNTHQTFYDYKAPVKEEKPYPTLMPQPQSHLLLTEARDHAVKMEPQPEPYHYMIVEMNERDQRESMVPIEYTEPPLKPPQSPPEPLPEVLGKEEMHVEHAKEHSDIKMSEEEEYAIMNILELTKSPQI
jgi:hypothetical protein